MKLVLHSGEEHDFEIKSNQLNSILKYVTLTYPTTIIYRHNKKFNHDLQILLRKELASCQNIQEVTVAGWYNVDGTGQYVYAEDGANPPSGVCFKTGFSFCRGKTPTHPVSLICILEILLKRLSKHPGNSIIPILYAHVGCMWQLLKDAGFPPRFLLFIEGPTGSLKTSVASVIFNFSGLSENAVPASFRDTSASHEIKFREYKDSVLLIDDFCPPADSKMQKTMEASLEQIIRFVGDGIAKSRATPTMERQPEQRPQGMIAITGEDSSGSHSSLLRCLFVQVMKDSYDKELLSSLQRHPNLWTEYIACFVETVGPRAREVIQYIQDRFPVYRSEADDLLDAKRYIDAYATLKVVSDIMFYVMKTIAVAPMPVDINEPPDQALADLYELVNHEIFAVCKYSERKATVEAPVHIFARIVCDLYQKDEILIGSIDEYKADPKKYIGAKKDGYWYLRPKDIYRVVKEAYTHEGKVFPKTERALWGDLAAAGVLHPVVSETRTEYGTKVSFAGRSRLLEIDPNRLQDLADNAI